MSNVSVDADYWPKAAELTMLGIRRRLHAAGVDPDAPGTTDRAGLVELYINTAAGHLQQRIASVEGDLELDFEGTDSVPEVTDDGQAAAQDAIPRGAHSLGEQPGVPVRDDRADRSHKFQARAARAPTRGELPVAYTPY